MPPNPQVAWICRIHTAGGASSSTTTTMVVAFIVCLCCCVMQSLLIVVTCMYRVPEHNIKVCILPYYKVSGVIFLSHLRVHHTPWWIINTLFHDEKTKKIMAHTWPIAIIGRNTGPMVLSSGYYQSPGPPPLGNLRGIVPAHRRGHQHGQQSWSIFVVVSFAATLAATRAIPSN